ncbi:cell wall-active antibiotics response protein [candidate division KSB1 bacterium]|nr:cell wall-active antibiotics response protein [candidate division KSB1 bacterium]NIR68663.1 cell wall-active antibiotics response protein [candidate division KSB1 bacterium]NIS27152.1 cell wall-active antibiotics response protein [candidate division KSB1 bacterium]NIT74038.1 cell wall-active antibiotics response protein [candidate division KSB1 bacterium]NIU27904.1 cell wall-active antibiotics response protein [candidate division KSB1 bacterium]
MFLSKFAIAVLPTLIFLLPASSFAQRAEVNRFKEKYSIPADKVFRVDIEIDAGEVTIHKSPNDKEARVIIDYDEEEFRVYSDFDEKRSRLDIEFEKKGWGNSKDNAVAEALIELPTGVEVDLEAKIKAGEIDLDFGGLALTRLDLTTWAGEVVVGFSEPNKSDMEFMKINTKVGETRIRELGNARFREAEINGGIGEMSVDLRGNMLSEAEAHIDLDIGETTLYLPEEAGVKLVVSKFLFLSDVSVPYGLKKSGRYYYSKNFDVAKNRLDVRVSPGLGELQIDY